MKNLISFIILFLTILVNSSVTPGQCIQLLSSPGDTIGWKEYSDHPGKSFYNNDTFVVTTSTYGENNYIYNTFPATLNGAASSFSASFDFRIDSNSACSDGLTFWFFTSSLFGLGSTSKEGGDLGFPDTVSGFALAFRTIGCVDEIYMKKINSTSYSWSGGSGPDTNIAPKLTSQMFLTDGRWHHCIVNYVNGFITTTFDTGGITMSGYSPIYGTGHFGFMGTNGGGYSRKCIKNVQICAGYGTPTASADSFNIYLNRQCNGPTIDIHANTYSSAYYVKTFYGDGSYDSSGFAPDLSGGGYVLVAHTYAAPGDYTIRAKLYNGSTVIDSLHTDFENVFCATLPVKFYYDANSDCLLEPGEPYLSQPVLTEVDSNGVPVDTVSATGGFYYNVKGTIGDIYSFKVISLPGNMQMSCPSSGIINESLVPGIFIYPIKYFAINCSTGTSFDLAVNAVIPVTGIHDEWGNIYVSNNYCAPTNGRLTLHYSSKYAGAPSQVSPTPLTVAGDSIVWDVSALSSMASAPTQLHYQINYASTTLTVGDTVHSYFTLLPASGDVYPANNSTEIIDTIRAGCDPNEMSVFPAGCIGHDTASVKLQYTINFTNVGNDTAFNIYVMDTLSNNVDISSLRLKMASNTMNIFKYQNATYNIVKFDFPAINLVDSATCPQCNGAVVFTVNTRPGLPIGSTIFSHAGVFFDDNPVVMTNVVENFVGDCPTPLISPQVTHINAIDAVYIFPNPAQNTITVSVTNGAYTSFTINNTLGQHLVSQSINADQSVVNVSMLPAGIYYIALTGDNGTAIRKFVKE